MQHLGRVAASRCAATDSRQASETSSARRVAERDVVELDAARRRAGRPTASGFSWIIGGRSSTSKTRSKLTSAVITSIRTLESALERAEQPQQQRGQREQGADGERSR